MDPLVYIIIGAYIVACAIGVAASTVVQTWLPVSLQPGRSRAWLGSCAWLFSIILSPLLLLGLAVFMPARWATGAMRRRYAQGLCNTCTGRNKDATGKQQQKQKKREKKASNELLEAGCNFDDSVLSLSDMPPMYEDCLFKATSTSSPSPRSSLF